MKFWVKSKPRDLKIAVDILFERLFSSLFKEEDIEQEKKL